MSAGAIGGYLELELPFAGDGFYRDAMHFQSARNAFLALLLARRPAAVWMPWYVCDSMMEPFRMAGTPVKYYALDERFNVADASPGANEWLLYVNYFGLHASNVANVLERFPAMQVVIDQSQAFFSPPASALATLYSPRKFFGVPDGGYLVTRELMPAPASIDEGSLVRAIPLLKRHAAGAEVGYAEYVAGEAQLSGQQPTQMSLLTRRLLAGIDYAEVKRRRTENFAFLASTLGHLNQLYFDLPVDGAPLCYPFLGAPAGTRAMLAQARIYTPCYWQEVANNESAPVFERRIASETLFLPCDQRLSRVQLASVAQRLIEIQDGR